MRTRLLARPLGLLGCGLLLGEALIAVLGLRAPVLSAVALVVAPGLALIPLLPKAARQSPTAAVAASPALGLAGAAVALVSLSALGLPLTGLSVRALLIVLAGAAVLALPAAEPRLLLAGAERWAAVGLAGAVALGLILQARVLAGSPVPGNDWGKYLLYADEIRRGHSLLIDNPYWMLGVPFREEPGAPALYGSYLLMTGESAAVLAHGIWVFAVTAVLSVYALVRACWGPSAAVLAAGLWAVLPVNHDILAWHGLPNTLALALLPLLLLYLVVLLDKGLDRVAAGGLALTLAALLATHRLSTLLAAVAIGGVLVVGAFREDRRRLARDASAAGALALLLSAGVLYDLWSRNRGYGGTQDYTAYLSSKVDPGLVAGDLSYAFTAAALGAVVVAIGWVRRDHRLVPLLCLLVVAVALAYSWLAHVPLVYFRMAYFLPLALVPLVAIAAARLLSGRRVVVAGVVLCAVITPFAWVQGGNVRDFYGFTRAESLAALDRVASELEPREVVVTDRCWSFLATWLLHTRTLAALEPEDIQPRAEVRRAAQAKRILAGDAEGRALARRLGVRYAVVDPTCADVASRALRPAVAGKPVFFSKRLAVFRLSGARAP